MLVICLGVASGPLFVVLTRWSRCAVVPFNAGFWSFSFPLAALAGATVKAVRRGGWPSQVGFAAVLIASSVIGFLPLRTLVLLARGRLLPPH
jgi:tellurite resistance protein